MMSQDMPTVNPVCLFFFPVLGAQAYLMQRNSRALTRSALTRYYLEGDCPRASLGLSSLFSTSSAPLDFRISGRATSTLSGTTSPPDGRRVSLRDKQWKRSPSVGFLTPWITWLFGVRFSLCGARRSVVGNVCIPCQTPVLVSTN
jgi:hypothetical protein